MDHEGRGIGVLSAGKVTGALYALLGLVFGALFALVSQAGVAAGAASSGSTAEAGIGGLFFGVGSAVFLPMFYGVLGFVFGPISALLHNVVARFIGGIEIEVE